MSSAPHTTDPQATRIARAWRVLAATFGLLGAIAVLDVLVGGSSLLRVAVAVLVGVAAAAAVVHRQAAQALEERRRAEAGSFARILQGLSRSVSPDAIVGAIAEDLGEVTGADHVVVVRLRPNTGLLEATLVTTRHGVPSSTTTLPLSDLDDPGEESGSGSAIPRAVAVGPGRDEPSTARPAAHGRRDHEIGREAAGRAGDRAAGLVADGVGDDAMVLADDRLVRLSAGSTRRTPVAALSRTASGTPADAARAAASRRVAERLGRRARVVFGLRNVLVAPLETSTGVVGALVLSRRTAEPWPSSARRLMTDAAVEASAALARAYSHRAAEVGASTDPLTGLPNRRYFEEVCGLFAQRRRARDAVGILMIDIDHFKALNDRFGHAVGDDVLRAVAGAIVSAVRDDDVPARYGGEEFVVLLRNPAPGVSVDVGERVRAAVRALDLSAHGVDRVSVSVGVAVASTPEERIGDLIEQADRNLYRAKRAGRDRVVAA